MFSTDESPVSDHPECKEIVVVLWEVVAYENQSTRGPFQEENPILMYPLFGSLRIIAYNL